MEDRSFATVGVALAALALAAAAFPWDAAGAGPFESVPLAAFGAVALLAFSLRRHGLVEPRLGAPVAGLASLAAVGYAALAAVGGAGVLDGATSLWGPALAAAGGLGGIAAAYADLRGLSTRTLSVTRAVGWSFAVGFAGLFAIAVWTNVVVAAVTALVPGEPSPLEARALGSVALGLGTGTVALAYFGATDRDRSFLDVSVPSARDLGYVAAGVVALFALQFAMTAIFDQLGVSVADHSIERAARRDDPSMLLWLSAASWLVVGPGEELLYRNIIQKSLYDVVSERRALVVTSVVFALVHVPSYYTPDLAALAATLGVIFLLSLVLGWVYVATENLAVPIVVHGTLDGVIFAVMYLELTGAIPTF